MSLIGGVSEGGALNYLGRAGLLYALKAVQKKHISTYQS